MPGCLSGFLYYIINLFLHSVSKKLGEKVPVDSVVEEWVGALKEKGYYAEIILGFDSYFFSKSTGSLILKSGICAIASVCGSSRLKSIWDYVNSQVTQSGDVGVAYDKSTNEMFVYYWDPDKNIGKKSAWTNCCGVMKRVVVSIIIIPAYDRCIIT